VIQKARREKRFRPRAARIDSTVVEADVRYPTDAGLAADGVRALAREGRKLAAKVKQKRTAVRDRSRAMGPKLRALTRSIRRRSEEAKSEVLALTAETAKLLEQSIREARTLAATARRRARGRGARAKLRAAHQLEELADRCEKVTEQGPARRPVNDRYGRSRDVHRAFTAWKRARRCGLGRLRFVARCWSQSRPTARAGI
jgi:hypothetical protein